MKIQMDRKLARMPMECPPHQLLAAWVNHPSKVQRPQQTLQNTMIKILKEALANQITDNGHLNDWIDTAQNKSI